MFSVAALSLASVVTLLCAEAMAQFWVYKLAGQAKLFQPDEDLGWKLIPNLRQMRKNANGRLVEVGTNAQGFRGRMHWDTTKGRKVLVLGDSFAFGEGVALEERFDSILDQKESFSVVNRGVPGFGTGQALLAGRDRIQELAVGDDLILLTYSNDFYDLARRSFAGRARPTFRHDGDKLIVGPAAVTWREQLRDKSYILSLLLRMFEEQRTFSLSDLKKSSELYSSLIDSFLVPLARRGVRVHLVHHGTTGEREPEHRAQIVGAIRSACATPEILCLSLDQQLDKGSYFLDDGHWTAEGHAVVGTLILSHLSSASGTQQ